MKSIACLLVGLTFMLAGCASPQVRYHTLVNPQPVAHPAASQNFVIEMMPVGVPAQLDTQQVVIRQSDSSIAVLDDDRWLSPLGDELQTALSSRITQQFSTVDIAGLAPDNGKPAVRILVQIRRFDSWPGNAVSLDADWSLSTLNAQTRSRLVCKSHLSQTLSGEGAPLFSAWQQVVDRLANQIGQTASDWVATGQAVCHRD